MPQYSRKLSKGIRWFYKFDFCNKTYISKCIYLSKKEASQAERERYNQLDEERRFGKQDKPLSLKHCIDDRLIFLNVKYTNGHYVNSDHYLNLFLDFTGDREIREINRKDVEDFLLDYSNKVQEDGFDNYQVNAALKSIKSLFNYTIESYDLVIKNPCKNIKPFPINKHLKYIPPDDDIQTVRGYFNKRQQLLFDFVMETGCRINEAIALDFSDIHDNYLILYTKKSKHSDKIPRKADIPDCIKGLKGKGRVFHEWTERPKFLDRTLREKNMRVWGWHSLRHRYASKLSKAGTPLFEIMQKLGHSQITTTQLYLQLLP